MILKVKFVLKCMRYNSQSERILHFLFLDFFYLLHGKKVFESNSLLRKVESSSQGFELVIEYTHFSIF